jgi:ubiquinone/menaquinone biosynthesis C-methylase UbiE
VSNQQKKIDKTVGFYDTFSTKYERRYSAYLEHTHKRLLEAMDLSAGERILDISCGTGLLAAELTARFPGTKLTLNDPSEGMLAMAKERFKHKPSVQFTNYTAEGIRFDEESFDRVICLNSFHYYADQPLVIENISQVLKPGGRFIILDWNREGWFHIPNAIISCL